MQVETLNFFSLISFIGRKTIISEEHRPPNKQFIEVIDFHHSGESASEREDNLQSQSLDRRISSSEVDRKIKAIVAPLDTHLETLIQAKKN